MIVESNSIPIFCGLFTKTETQTNELSIEQKFYIYTCIHTHMQWFSLSSTWISTLGGQNTKSICLKVSFSKVNCYVSQLANKVKTIVWKKKQQNSDLWWAICLDLCELWEVHRNSRLTKTHYKYCFVFSMTLNGKKPRDSTAELCCYCIK